MTEPLTTDRLRELERLLGMATAPFTASTGMPFRSVDVELADLLALVAAARERDEHVDGAAHSPATPRPGAPLDVAALPDWWDEQRRLAGKGPSTCGAELRIAMEAKRADAAGPPSRLP